MENTFEKLHRAIKRGDLLQLMSALDSGVDVNVRNRNDRTLLMLAASTGNTAIGKALIERGANIETDTTHAEAGMQYSALSHAIMNGKPSFVELLIAHGALQRSPFKSSFYAFLEWCDKYSSATPQQMASIRRALAKSTRNEVATGTSATDRSLNSPISRSPTD